MKKSLKTAVILLAYFLVMNAQAADLKGRFALSLSGGSSFPIGDFKDAFKTGLGGGGELEYFILPKLSIGANFTYNGFKTKMDFGPDIDLLNADIDSLESFLANPDLPSQQRIITERTLVMTKDLLASFIEKEESRYKYYCYGGFGKYYFFTEKEFIPYIRFGLNFNTPIWGGSTGASKIGVSLGGGGLLRAGEKIMLGTEAIFHNIFTEGSSTQHITIYGKLVFLF